MGCDINDTDGLLAYSGYDHVGDLNERRSCTSYVFQLCGSCVSWRVTIQAICASHQQKLSCVINKDGE